MGGQVAVWEPRGKRAGILAYLMLHNSMHLGKDGSGIAVSNKEGHNIVKGFDNPRSAFKDNLDQIIGNIAIGSTQYSASHLNNSKENVPPISAKHQEKSISICLDGKIANSEAIYSKIERKRILFTDRTDEELLMFLIVKSKKPEISQKIIDALKQVQGSYNALIMVDDEIFAARSPEGTIPLSIARHNSKTVLATDKHCFQILSSYIGEDYEAEEVEPGVLYNISKEGVQKKRFAEKTKSELCFHTIDYFSMPTYQKIARFKEEVGMMIAEKYGHLAKAVAVVPNSGIHYKNGFVKIFLRQNQDNEEVILFTRTHYGGSKILPEDPEYISDLDFRAKYSVCNIGRKLKSLFLIDDMVRSGSTLRWITSQARTYAEKVVVVAGSPEIIGNCPRRRDFEDKSFYAGKGRNNKQIAELLGADFYVRPSMDEVLQIAEKVGLGRSFCTFCYKK